MNHDRDALIELIARACDRDISQYDDAFLTQSLQKRMLATGAGSIAAYAAGLAENAAEAATFARSLEITYSEFFRDPLVFALLEARILPALARERAKSKRPEIRVWSAGCAAGQEAYSIAILLDGLAASTKADLSYRIFASDISADRLITARRGIFTAPALANVRLRHLNEYFVRHGDTYAIVPRLREHVDFSLHDLFDPLSKCPASSIFGDFDLVFCSNLLFYYRAALRLPILERVISCMAPTGYLVTGETERDSVARAADLEAASPPAPIFRRVWRGR